MDQFPALKNRRSCWMQHRILATLLCIFFVSALHAQIHLGIPSLMGKGGSGTAFIDDFQAVGVNPANLGLHDEEVLSAGLLNFGVDLNSKGLSNFDLLTYRSSFSHKDIDKLSSVFRADGFNMNADMTWAGIAFHTDNLGGFALTVRDRSSSHISMSDQVADILFKGSNASYFDDPANLTNVTTADVFDDMHISFLHYREINLAYGVKAFSMPGLKLYGGVGVKRLYGLGYLDVTSGNGIFSAKASFMGSYEIDYDEVALQNGDIDNSFFRSSGKGEAFDFSATAVIGEAEDPADNFIVSMSVMDIGSIRWDKNTLQAGTNGISQVDPTGWGGMRSFAVKDITQALFDSSGLVYFEERTPFKTNLPATFRLGVGKEFNQIVRVSVDFIAPLSARYSVSFNDPYIVLGADVKALEGLWVMSGISRNQALGLNLPAGIRYQPGRIIQYQIGTADVSTFFRGKGSRMSIAMGMRLNLL